MNKDISDCFIHNLYASSNIVGVITSMRMRWSEHVACMGEN